MPLGAAALAGTSFPINRPFLADELGFDALMSNSLDAVSARDFITEFLAATAICMQHLSRWSEELILWCTAQFGFVELPGSSVYRLVHYAAEEEPRSTGANPRQERPRLRQSRHTTHIDEGPASRLQQR